MPAPRPPRDLVKILSLCQESAAVEKLLRDLLTPAELEAINERWAIVKLLRAGLSQREVRDRLGVSVTTVSRGSKQLKYGHGGFDLAFGLLESSK